MHRLKKAGSLHYGLLIPLPACSKPLSFELISFWKGAHSTLGRLFQWLITGTQNGYLCGLSSLASSSSIRIWFKPSVAVLKTHCQIIILKQLSYLPVSLTKVQTSGISFPGAAVDYTPLVPPSSFSFSHFKYFFWDQHKADCLGVISQSACLGLCMNNYVLSHIFKVFQCLGFIES